MGRYLLCGKEALVPYEVEDLDLRLYTIEELCYFIYYGLPLLQDDFIDERLLAFIRDALDMKDEAEKIEKLYSSPSDMDATLQMILSDVGYFSESEMADFQSRVVERRRKNPAERVRMRADMLAEKKRYQAAIRIYKSLLSGGRDGRLTVQFYTGVQESLANCLGKLCDFDQALLNLEKIYDQTGHERILKKIYNVCVLSGRELPNQYFEKVGDAKLNIWQQEYWNRETAAKARMENGPEMQIFMKQPDEAREALKQYVQTKKEEYRGMLS